jgi:hypothetical protein
MIARNTTHIVTRSESSEERFDLAGFVVQTVGQVGEVADLFVSTANKAKQELER